MVPRRVPVLLPPIVLPLQVRLLWSFTTVCHRFNVGGSVAGVEAFAFCWRVGPGRSCGTHNLNWHASIANVTILIPHTHRPQLCIAHHTTRL